MFLLTSSQMRHTACPKDGDKLFFICPPLQLSSLEQGLQGTTLHESVTVLVSQGSTPFLNSESACLGAKLMGHMQSMEMTERTQELMHVDGNVPSSRSGAMVWESSCHLTVEHGLTDRKVIP